MKRDEGSLWGRRLRSVATGGHKDSDCVPAGMLLPHVNHVYHPAPSVGTAGCTHALDYTSEGDGTYIGDSPNVPHSFVFFPLDLRPIMTGLALIGP